jgi:anti-anti-sigma regulatory factor
MNHIWTWMRNGTPVLTTPPEGIDMANDLELRGKLLSVIAWNPVVVVDGSTYRTFFSVSAMRVLDEAGRRMAAAGGELRLVTTRPMMRRDLEIVGYGSHLRIFRDLDEALEVPQQARMLQPQAA